jgi:hypothetical protein
MSEQQNTASDAPETARTRPAQRGQLVGAPPEETDSPEEIAGSFDELTARYNKALRDEKTLGDRIRKAEAGLANDKSALERNGKRKEQLRSAIQKAQK